MRRPSLDSVFLPLWFTYALVPLLAGLDKFTYLLADWDAYIAPVFLRLMPFSGRTFMLLVGVIELVVGLAAFTRFRRLASYVAAVWLVLIATNLVIGGFFDIALRDLAIAVGAFTLGQLAGVRGEPILPGHADGAAEPARPVAS